MLLKDRWCDDANLQVVDTDQFVQAGGHHHFPQDGHYCNSMTVALINPHKLTCLWQSKKIIISHGFFFKRRITEIKDAKL